MAERCRPEFCDARRRDIPESARCVAASSANAVGLGTRRAVSACAVIVRVRISTASRAMAAASTAAGALPVLLPVLALKLLLARLEVDPTVDAAVPEARRGTGFGGGWGGRLALGDASGELDAERVEGRRARGAGRGGLLSLPALAYRLLIGGGGGGKRSAVAGAASAKVGVRSSAKQAGAGGGGSASDSIEVVESTLARPSEGMGTLRRCAMLWTRPGEGVRDLWARRRGVGEAARVVGDGNNKQARQEDRWTTPTPALLLMGLKAALGHTRLEMVALTAVWQYRVVVVEERRGEEGRLALR